MGPAAAACPEAAAEPSSGFGAMLQYVRRAETTELKLLRLLLLMRKTETNTSARDAGKSKIVVRAEAASGGECRSEVVGQARVKNGLRVKIGRIAPKREWRPRDFIMLMRIGMIDDKVQTDGAVDEV